MAEIYRDIISGEYHKVGERDSDVFITSNAGVPADGGSGFGVNVLGKGSLVIDTVGGFLYENRGTKASPTWDAIGAIGESEIAAGAVTVDKLGDGAVTETKLNASVAGEGLEGGAGTPLSVVISEDTVVEPEVAVKEIGAGDARLTLTADTAGASGNDITLTILDSTGEDVELAVALVGTDITVTPATDGSGVITSTPQTIVIALNDDTDIAALVTASVENGAGTDPIVALAETALEGGVDGTVGYKGQMLFDASNLYISVDDSTVAVGNWKKAALATIS